MTGVGSCRVPSIRLRIAALLATLSCGALVAGDATEAFDRPTFQVRRATSEIVVDGALDESAWADALLLELNYEVSPGENIPPPVRTELRVAFDESRLYFGFRAFDPDPSRIRARFSDRDKSWDDDWVGVALDTFNDERRAYEMMSNPLGVQTDAINDDTQGEYDTNWNAIWHSAGRLTDFGYEVEIAIPFHQIRFQDTGENEQTWGFDAFRSYPRENRHHIGLFPRLRGSNTYLGQAVKLSGVEATDSSRNLELIPTLTSGRLDERADVPDGELETGDIRTEVGATVRWGVTPNVNLLGAINPDFSQVEADVLRLDINERFTLYFPETRPFFLEGIDDYNTPLNLVHTRVVMDPAYAAKVTGKVGRHTFGVFAAQDDSTSMLFPGAEESSAEVYDGFETTDFVGRYRYDYGKNSLAGVTITDRRGGNYHNQVASADTVYRISDADEIVASFAASRTRYDEVMVASAGVEEGEFEDIVIEAEYTHTVRDWWVNFEVSNVGDGFRADLGFIPQVGFREWEVRGARVWWGDGERLYNRLAWGGEVGRRKLQDGGLLDERVESWIDMEAPLQSNLSVNVTMRNQTFNGVRFDDQWFLHTRFDFRPTKDLQLTFHQDYGDWIDFANTKPAKRTVIQPSIRYHLGRHLLFDYEHTYSKLDVEGGRLFRAHAPELRMVYQFNTRAFIRAILQYTDIERDPSLYAPPPPGEEPVDRISRDFFTQLLFTYKVNPYTAIYAGYSDNYVADDDYDMTQVARALFVKLAYAWVP